MNDGASAVSAAAGTRFFGKEADAERHVFEALRRAQREQRRRDVGVRAEGQRRSRGNAFAREHERHLRALRRGRIRVRKTPRKMVARHGEERVRMLAGNVRDEFSQRAVGVPEMREGVQRRLPVENFFEFRGNAQRRAAEFFQREIVGRVIRRAQHEREDRSVAVGVGEFFEMRKQEMVGHAPFAFVFFRAVGNVAAEHDFVEALFPRVVLDVLPKAVAAVGEARLVAEAAEDFRQRRRERLFSAGAVILRGFDVGNARKNRRKREHRAVRAGNEIRRRSAVFFQGAQRVAQPEPGVFFEHRPAVVAFHDEEKNALRRRRSRIQPLVFRHEKFADRLRVFRFFPEKQLRLRGNVADEIRRGALIGNFPPVDERGLQRVGGIEHEVVEFFRGADGGVAQAERPPVRASAVENDGARERGEEKRERNPAGARERRGGFRDAPARGKKEQRPRERSRRRREQIALPRVVAENRAEHGARVVVGHAEHPDVELVAVFEEKTEVGDFEQNDQNARAQRRDSRRLQQCAPPPRERRRRAPAQQHGRAQIRRRHHVEAQGDAPRARRFFGREARFRRENPQRQSSQRQQKHDAENAEKPKRQKARRVLRKFHEFLPKKAGDYSAPRRRKVEGKNAAFPQGESVRIFGFRFVRASC